MGREDVSELESIQRDLAIPLPPNIKGGLQGAVLFRGARGWEILPPATSGKLLICQGSDKDVKWN